MSSVAVGRAECGLDLRQELQLDLAARRQRLRRVVVNDTRRRPLERKRPLEQAAHLRRAQGRDGVRLESRRRHDLPGAARRAPGAPREPRRQEEAGGIGGRAVPEQIELRRHRAHDLADRQHVEIDQAGSCPASKYSSAMLRPPTTVARLSTVNDLLCIRWLSRWKSASSPSRASSVPRTGCRGAPRCSAAKPGATASDRARRCWHRRAAAEPGRRALPPARLPRRAGFRWHRRTRCRSGCRSSARHCAPDAAACRTRDGRPRSLRRRSCRGCLGPAA